MRYYNHAIYSCLVDPLFSFVKHRILSLVSGKREELEMIDWMVNGNIPEHDQRFVFEATEVEKRVIIKRKYMEARCEYGKSNYDNFVSIDELLDLIIASGFKCVITGWYTLIHNNNAGRYPYWAFSIDHIVALTLAKESSWFWSKYNMQIMSHGLNFVKGSYSNA